MASWTAAGYHLFVALKYMRSARLWWTDLPKSGPVGNAIAQSISSFLSEAAMDKLLADVDAMFSAIADSIYKRQLTMLES